MENSDRQLWKRAQSRDKEAFSKLYDRYFNRLYLFALKKTGGEEAAMDVVQESFLKLWEKATDTTDTNDVEKNVEAFLVTIVRNTAYDWLRKQKSRQARHARLYFIQGNEVHRDQHLWEVAGRLEKAYSQMPQKTFEIFHMSRSDGFTYEEISRRVGLSVKSVEFHISKALVILREVLKDYL